MVASALIQAGGALLGGILGKSKPVSARQSFNSHMQGVMESAAKYGFNPLALLNVASPGFSAGDNSSMGAGVADAAMFLGDALAKKTDAMKLQQVAAERDKLQRQVETLTLRPKVPGVYGRGGTSITMGGPNDGTGYVSANGAASERPSGRADGAGPASGNPLLEVDPIDTRRGVENKDVGTTAGVMVVDNPYTGRMYFPTIDGDEPLDLLDIPSVAAGVPQLAYNHGHNLSFGGGRESRPQLTRQEAIEMRDTRVNKKLPRPYPVRNFNPNHRDGYYLALP